MFIETSSVKISYFMVYLVVYKILKRDFNVLKQTSLELKETIFLTHFTNWYIIFYIYINQGYI